MPVTHIAPGVARHVRGVCSAYNRTQQSPRVGSVDMTGQEEAGEGRPRQNDDIKVLFSMVMKLFEHWRLSESERTALLGLRPSDEGANEPSGAADALGYGRDVEERVVLLLGIHSQLRTLFPHNQSLAYGSMTSPNLAFDNMTPMAFVRT